MQSHANKPFRASSAIKKDTARAMPCILPSATQQKSRLD